ncbi:MAG: PIG-L family deacetylase [Kiritimatiellae bacterium]|nr:PIG-L family deacetylase [Kiritimatiellia bacterium]
MNFSRKDTDIFVPDNTAMPGALARTTHLCIGAHQDDQEFMAYHGIAACFNNPNRWFSGVCVTNGSGSARGGIYEKYSDEEMMAIRKLEQRKAAFLGEYGCEIQLAHPSSTVKDATNSDVVDDLRQILEIATPEVVYLHNPADKHDTHVASMMRAITAIRSLPAEQRPAKVYGAEIWRSLDWLNDEDKEVLPVDNNKNLAASLCGIFDSQITGGKRYDLATMGRQAANATFFSSHETDTNDALTWAVDLTPLINDDSLSVTDHIISFIKRFEEDVTNRINNLT